MKIRKYSYKWQDPLHDNNSLMWSPWDSFHVDMQYTMLEDTGFRNNLVGCRPGILDGRDDNGT